MIIALGVCGFVAAVAIAGVSGYMIFNNSVASVKDGSSVQTNNSEIIKIPAITNAIAAPEGWKSFKSKKFGVSFTVPKEWSVNENDPAKYGSIATGIYGDTISVFNPEHNSGTFDVRVTRQKINDAVADYRGSSNEDSRYTYTTKTTKWQDYSAVELKISDKTSRQSDGYTALFVQISDYVFSIPNLDSASVDADMDGYDEFKQFIASIRVDSKVVAAQAKIDAKPIEIRQGKNIDYGKVSMPAGWRKATSSKYGISFIMRDSWRINEQTQLNGGAVLSLTIGSSERYGDQVTVLVTTEGLDEFMNQSTYIAGVFGGGKIKAVKEKMKWHGYDARRVILRSDLQETSMLFVRVGNYTYMLPDPSSVWKSTAKSGGYTQEDYQILVKSIRISK